MSKRTGGFFFARPASKTSNHTDSDISPAQAGATVHDVYAGLAMHALLSANPDRRYDIATIAAESQLIADAMLAERAK